MQLLRLCVIYLLHNKRNALNSSYTLASSAGIFTVFASTFALDISAAEETSCDAADKFECSEEGSQPPESKNDKENPRLDKPIWWDYSIDDLFEKYFNCAEILYGYGKNKSPHKKQVPESQDDYDDEMDDDYDYDDDDEIFDDSDNEGDEDEDTTTADTKGTSEWWEKHRRTIRHEFVTMRDKYRKEVNLIPVKDGEFNSVMTVPAEIGDAFEKGRGVFATEPIPKGALVTNLDNDHVGIFKEGHSWRKFAVSLPREMACDFIEWSFVQDMPPAYEGDDDIRNGLTIFIAFDESNLVNNAEWGEEDANTRCGSPPEHWKSAQTNSENESLNTYDIEEEWGPCRFHYYATRDIAAGEEILINYSEFEDVSQKGWADIGL